MLDLIPIGQHCPFILQISSAAVTHREIPFWQRFNFKRAIWLGFTRDLDSALVDIPPIPSKYDAFVECVKSFSRRNIPLAVAHAL